MGKSKKHKSGRQISFGTFYDEDGETVRKPPERENKRARWSGRRRSISESKGMHEYMSEELARL